MSFPSLFYSNLIKDCIKTEFFMIKPKIFRLITILNQNFCFKNLKIEPIISNFSFIPQKYFPHISLLHFYEHSACQIHRNPKEIPNFRNSTITTVTQIHQKNQNHTTRHLPSFQIASDYRQKKVEN